MPCITQAPAILTGEASATSTLLPSPNIARSAWGRLRYRLYRHPLVMFGIGPAYLFILQYRLPVGMMRSGWRPWASTMGINLAISLIVGVTRLAHRDQSIPTHSPSDHAARVVSRGLVVLCATSIRGHDMGGGERVRFAPAALHGSSHYDLPASCAGLRQISAFITCITYVGFTPKSGHSPAMRGLRPSHSGHILRTDGCCLRANPALIDKPQVEWPVASGPANMSRRCRKGRDAGQALAYVCARETAEGFSIGGARQ